MKLGSRAAGLAGGLGEPQAIAADARHVRDDGGNIGRGFERDQGAAGSIERPPGLSVLTQAKVQEISSEALCRR